MPVCGTSKHKFIMHKISEKVQVMLYLLSPSLAKALNTPDFDTILSGK